MPVKVSRKLSVRDKQVRPAEIAPHRVCSVSMATVLQLWTENTQNLLAGWGTSHPRGPSLGLALPRPPQWNTHIPYIRLILKWIVLCVLTHDVMDIQMALGGKNKSFPSPAPTIRRNNGSPSRTATLHYVLCVQPGATASLGDGPDLIAAVPHRPGVQ